MSLDFQRIKAVPITDVLARYGVRLRFNGEWGSAQCPLPSHKTGDTDKTFQVNTRQNFWKCWSASCNEKAGAKGGDVINLVALKENISQYEAAKKIAEWFHLDAKKPAPHRETRAEIPQQKSQRTESNSDKSSGKSNGYLHSVGLLLDDILKRGEQEEDGAYLHRVKKAAMTLVRQSYVNGKRESQGLAVQ